jgi:hypothetical protein
LPDGKRTSAVNIVTEIDNDSYTWQSINRTVDGEVLPNIDEVLIVRKPDDADVAVTTDALTEPESAAEQAPATN